MYTARLVTLDRVIYRAGRTRATTADVDRAVAAAQDGAKRMAALSAYRRFEILEAVAGRIEVNQNKLGDLQCRE
jgi:acyl-CoA reductase-like NAD-dependent aldehyde dehydrogenase